MIGRRAFDAVKSVAHTVTLMTTLYPNAQGQDLVAERLRHRAEARPREVRCVPTGPRACPSWMDAITASRRLRVKLVVLLLLLTVD